MTLFEIIQSWIAETFGNEVAILILLSGYLLFLVLFYTNDENSPIHLIWNDFQWGDRILIGAIIGFLMWLLFIWPFTISFDQFFLVVPRSIMKIYGFDKIFGIKQQILVTGILFIIILMIRKNTIILSNEGAKKIINLITLKVPIYLYSLILFMIFQIITYLFSYTFYGNYEIIKNFWLLELLLNIFSLPFLFFGISLIFVILIYFNINIDFNINKYFHNFYINVLQNKIGKIGQFKYWTTMGVIISLIISGSFIVIDKQYAIIIPKYEVYEKYDNGSLNLIQEPYSNNYFLTRNFIEKGKVLEPILNHTRYVVIKNPSNLRSNIFKITCNEDYVKLTEINNMNFLKILIKNTFIMRKKYNITLHYEMKIDKNVYITQSVGNRIALGNETYQIEYNLTIKNDYDELVSARNTFAALELYPTLFRNITISYFENGIRKKYSTFNYNINEDWFYPDIYINPKSTKNMRFIITGTS